MLTLEGAKGTQLALWALQPSDLFHVALVHTSSDPLHSNGARFDLPWALRRVLHDPALILVKVGTLQDPTSDLTTWKYASRPAAMRQNQFKCICK